MMHRPRRGMPAIVYPVYSQDRRTDDRGRFGFARDDGGTRLRSLTNVADVNSDSRSVLYFLLVCPCVRMPWSMPVC